MVTQNMPCIKPLPSFFFGEVQLAAVITSITGSGCDP